MIRFNVRSSRPWSTGLGLVLLACVASPPFAMAQESQRTLIRAKQIYTVAGDVIAPGEVLVVDGKVSFVGPSIELGLPAETVEVDTLIPGIVNAYGSYGLSGGDAEVSREVTPDFDTLSAVDWDSVEFREALDEGVTSSQIMPATESVFAGFACLVKTAGDSTAARVLNREQGVVLAMSSDPTSRNRSRTRPDSIFVRQPTNRMGVVWIIRNALHQANQGEAAKRLDPRSREVLAGMVAGSRPVLSVSRTDFDIRAAMDLGNEFGFKPVIYGGDEVYRMVDEFRGFDTGLVYTAMTAGTSRAALRGPEGTDRRWNVPGLLRDAGVTFCLGGDSLLDQARFAVRYGLSDADALQAITLAPARFLAASDRLGSIETGKDADLVALSGPPMQATSAVLWTMVNGQIYGKDENK